MTGPGRLTGLDKPCAYRLGFILLGPERRGFGTLFSAIYKRLPLNCGLTVKKKTLKGFDRSNPPSKKDLEKFSICQESELKIIDHTELME